MAKKKPPVGGKVRLSQLATKIQEEHDKCYSVAMDSLTHAKVAGELLDDAKALVPHGEWEKWVEDKCNLSAKTAREYMQIASSWPQIEEAKRRGRAVLGVFDAKKLLAKPKGKPKKEPDAPTTPVSETVSADEGITEHSQAIDVEATEVEKTENALGEPMADGPHGTPVPIPEPIRPVFETQPYFGTIDNALARIRELPDLMRNHLVEIEKALSVIEEGIPDVPVEQAEAVIALLRNMVPKTDIDKNTSIIMHAILSWWPKTVCGCWQDGSTDPGCERCAGFGWRAKKQEIKTDG